ncbi:uncharacterized protein A1O9_06433 [Exophiala aquamarina CBS 119918]|uniref:Amidase domain-containing protein n=1 Tax=Exophiala aquamarina CBS 119918 TaxID=1182545 RepID=A0A072PFF7_9EURO|nr:uncharacterized protein A1O9_06433 [Exophiala aquamarina CBS 119918]KEF58507.1 hypothetical protein A1O9_06433 [Exophiala aquamarina CBS 119918]
MTGTAKQSWEEIISSKRTQRESLVSPFKSAINGKRVTSEAVLQNGDIQSLIGLLSSGELKSQDLTNCLTEVLFADAVEQALKLDKYFASTGRLIGPLHGIPMTLKDQFNVKGVDSSIGYVSRAFKPAEEDAVLVKILRGFGAVILAKTNLPQSIMWCETECPLWGLTTNPKNPAFTPGGSTGGEAVLLALQASMIGWGTDIGGSIRIPSHINGLWGLKPTSSRLPYRGVPVSTEGQEHVPSSVGPLARTLSSLTFVMKLVVDAQSWNLDPRVTPIPWRQQVYEDIQSRPLTIGILADDGVVKVHPPIERALRELEATLRSAGHEIIQWDPSGQRECIEIMDSFYSADGGEDIRKEVAASGEPYIPHVETLINRGKAISVFDYWQLNKRKIAAQRAYSDKWNDTIGPISGRPVDVILMPTMPHTAVPHRTCRWVGYTKIWNFLDYTALSFPAGKVVEGIDALPAEAYEPRNEYDAWNWKLYDPQTMDGHPVGLQIVGRRFEEEKVLGAAKVIEKLMTR